MYDSKGTELSGKLSPFAIFFLLIMTKKDSSDWDFYLNSPQGDLAGVGGEQREGRGTPMVKPKRFHEEDTMCFSV